MSLRDLAIGALSEQEEAQRLAAAARKAERHRAASERTRQFFARLGTTDVVVDGEVFIMDGEDFHGKVGKDGATIFWWCQEHKPGLGGTYDQAQFSDLPSLGRALKKIDAARERGRFHQDPPKRSETP